MSQRVGPELVKVSAEPQRETFEPRNIPEAITLAKTLVASRLLPRSITTAEAAFAIIATGRELGLSAMQSLRSIHVIDGKPTLSADLIAGLCKQSPACAWFRLVESTDAVATYETQRRGEPEPTRMSFTFAEATRAGVTNKDNWRKYPAAMLRARCITALARAVYPDIAMGMYDPEELGGHVQSAHPQAEPVVLVAEMTPEQARSSAMYDEFLAQISSAESLPVLNGIAHRIMESKDELGAHAVDALRRKYAEAKGALK